MVSLPAGLKVKCESPKHDLLVHIGLVSYHIMVHKAGLETRCTHWGGGTLQLVYMLVPRLAGTSVW